VNGYVAFKKVRKATNDAVLLLEGLTNSGWAWQIGMGNESYPHIYITGLGPKADRNTEPEVLAIAVSKFVESVLGGFASDTDIWEPLKMDDPATHEGRELWGNSQVTVSVHRFDDAHIELSYHRRDRAPIRDWRVGQRIKNEICGPEWEGVELYPAESRLVDQANEYHIWCVPQRWPLGYDERAVMTQGELDADGAGGFGAVQRDPVVEEGLA
jgi:hypothetical protein